MNELTSDQITKIIIGLVIFAAVALSIIAIAQDPAGAVQALTTSECDINPNVCN